jgi:adenosylcobinamide kinase / adenosylcobinamide-phosphate guanylyltransferase
VRSGKSFLAERLALDSGLAVTYIATARGDDHEMRERIAHHRARRPVSWDLVEVGQDLAGVLAQRAGAQRCLLVDCLTLWLTGLLCLEAPGPPASGLSREPRDLPETGFEGDGGSVLARETAALLKVLPGLPGRIILVGNETGLGIVPLGELTRRFCDESGRVHQQLALLCDRVVLTVAGLPLVLKGQPLADSPRY